jgi:aryl-alcohol dehydrogenase-like predicted oxidoreductase
VLEDRAVLDELARLRQGGLAIGFTVSGPGQREAIEQGVELGAFDAVQATWNLHEQSAGPALAAAHGAGLGVMVKEAVANGRLTSRGGSPLLTEIARSLDTTPDAVALSAVLAQPWVDVVLSGATTRPMLESNLKAARIELGDELLERLDGLREDPKSYWETRGALPWY